MNCILGYHAVSPGFKSQLSWYWINKDFVLFFFKIVWFLMTFISFSSPWTKTIILILHSVEVLEPYRIQSAHDQGYVKLKMDSVEGWKFFCRIGRSSDRGQFENWSFKENCSKSKFTAQCFEQHLNKEEMFFFLTQWYIKCWCSKWKRN